MFSGRQPPQDVKVLRRFRDWLRSHLQGVADGLVEPTTTTGCPVCYWDTGHLLISVGSTKPPATP